MLLRSVVIEGSPLAHVRILLEGHALGDESDHPRVAQQIASAIVRQREQLPQLLPDASPPAATSAPPRAALSKTVPESVDARASERQPPSPTRVADSPPAVHRGPARIGVPWFLIAALPLLGGVVLWLSVTARTPDSFELTITSTPPAASLEVQRQLRQPGGHPTRRDHGFSRLVQGPHYGSGLPLDRRATDTIERMAASPHAGQHLRSRKRRPSAVSNR